MVATLTGACLPLCGPAPAQAAWSTTGAGLGRSAATTLAAVTGVTAACATLTTASVTWTATTYASSYTVARSSDLVTWTTIATTAGTSAVDSGLNLIPGLHPRWRVTAHRTNWNAPSSGPSNALNVSGIGVCS